MARSPLVSENSSSTIPEGLIGLWRRRLLETEILRDTDSEVWRLQTGQLYADLHLSPPGQPSSRRGVAGALELQGDVLTWQSWFDNQSPTDIGDSGRVYFEGETLIAHGACSSRREVWERVTPPTDDRMALALRDERSAYGGLRTRRGVFMVLGEHFVLALDRSLCLAGGGRTTAPRQRTFAAFRLEPEISFGVRHGSVSWEIKRSTLPDREGQSLLAVHGLPEQVSRSEWCQSSQIPAAYRRWQVVEIGSGFTGLF
ncbi:MAG: hypothetical protein M0Z84_15560 [Gammaproteobacteria bacterium]|nr:hypothetical protein [Gammaproteobacteria bacterium]